MHLSGLPMWCVCSQYIRIGRLIACSGLASSDVWKFHAPQKVQTRPFALSARRAASKEAAAARALWFLSALRRLPRVLRGKNLIPLTFKSVLSYVSVFGAAHRPPSEKAKKKKRLLVKHMCAVDGWWPRQIENDKWPPTPLNVIRFHERWAPNQIKRPQRAFTYYACAYAHSSCVGRKTNFSFHHMFFWNNMLFLNVRNVLGT